MSRRPHRLFAAAAALASLTFASTGAAQTSQAAAEPRAATATADTQPARPPVYGYEVVARYPHDPTAFTQGLEFHDGDLLESTGRSPSSIRRVRLEDGVVLQKRDLDRQFFGEGLTAVDDRLITLTWQGGHGFVWDLDDLEPAGTFSYSGEGWGLTHDDTRVILSDGGPHLRFLDPVTLAQTGSVPVTFMGRPLTRLNELEFIEGEVFANIWQTDFIVRIDPATGVVTGVIDLSGLLPDPVDDPADEVLNGIAWDAAGKRLFVTGKNWPTLFEIRLTDPE
ncbi:MAG: glutaminyl-peptide cyclotransferase [Alphaproteobacteria bacterium]|nr:glutaminyl-peptide cyclotransferase [Alphaproteobacteria bacterium]MBU2378076.1 glutaminyl-peptide cyclotransferase [Alphaproteobacteria bacterium]